MILRGEVESHSPFFDRDFVDAITAVDPARRFKHRLYLNVMARATPRAAAVKWQRTNMKPGRGYHANLAAMAFHRLVSKASAPFGLIPFPGLQVADLAGWFRGPWRTAVEELILSRRFVQRDLVDLRDRAQTAS